MRITRLKKAGLTPYFTDGTAGIEEADMIMVCKKCIMMRLNRECFDAGETTGKWDIRRKTTITMYIAEILKVLVQRVKNALTNSKKEVV